MAFLCRAVVRLPYRYQEAVKGLTLIQSLNRATTSHPDCCSRGASDRISFKRISYVLLGLPIAGACAARSFADMARCLMQ